MAAEPRDIVLAYYEAFARSDLPAMVDLLHPEMEFRAAENFIYADCNPYLGPSAVEKLAARLRQEWNGFMVLAEEIQGAGDLVIARGRYLGTYKATGFRLDAEFVHVFKFRDGKIILQHNYTDTAQFRDAIKRSREDGSVPATA
jgi:ketosteroid isomerase-like protein